MYSVFFRLGNWCIWLVGSSSEAVIEWLAEHLDEILEKYPQIKKKLAEKLKEELIKELATKKDIVAILEEIRKLREDYLHQQQQTQTLINGFRRQQEQIQALVEEVKALREAYATQQRQIQTLAEEIKNLREDFNILSSRLDIKISALGARWGILSEEAFRAGLKVVVERHFGGSVRKWTYYDKDGFVFGYPSEIDVDVLVRDREHILIEIKAHVDRGDVLEFYRKGVLYEKVTGVKPKMIFVTPFAEERAFILATKMGIEIITKIP